MHNHEANNSSINASNISSINNSLMVSHHQINPQKPLQEITLNKDRHKILLKIQNVNNKKIKVLWKCLVKETNKASRHLNPKLSPSLQFNPNSLGKCQNKTAEESEWQAQAQPNLITIKRTILLTFGVSQPKKNSLNLRKNKHRSQSQNKSSQNQDQPLSINCSVYPNLDSTGE